MSQLLPINKTIKRIIKMIIIGIVAMSVLIFCGLAIAHMVVFSRADYDQYDSDYNLIYDDIDKEKYPREQLIVNPNCTFVFMDEENHNGHYDYFLTDAALEYAADNPIPPIDKELYREHDVHIMDMIIEFFDS